jgi:hypothetical protein
MDPASIALMMISMQSAVTQTKVGVAALRMSEQSQADVLQLLDPGQQGQQASLPPGVGQNLNVTV